MHKLITVTTDFGDQFAAAQLKTIVSCLGFHGEVIENHSVAPFSITEGAFQIALITRFSPIGTVHLGVVDPGVGSQRRGIIVKTKRFWFVGPDNGLLSPAIEKEILENTWQIRENKISKEFSTTFHGRDIFIKAAVYIAQGKKPEDFGSIRIDSLSLERIFFKTGQVLHVDYFGNIKVYWPNEITIGKNLIIKNKHSQLELPIVKTFSDVPAGKPLAIIGSSYTLELAVNLDNASRLLNINSTDILDIAYKR
ncbi:SAM-dependent chlorinase/fluorinase [Candidatus Gottesmanbacteria bacterium]|nr:SAM-dependent chlorinase/fluorinase [Candidatus Gottesmanbacteria bacterium]